MIQGNVRILPINTGMPVLEYTGNVLQKTLLNDRSCIFPDGKWNMAASQRELFCTKENMSRDTIYLFRYEEKLARLFKDSIRPAMESLSQKELINFSLSVVGTIPGITLKEFRSCDLVLTPAGEISTAYDYEQQEYLGLHIDTHDNITHASRPEAFMVMGLNMGEGDRYFHFVDLTFHEIISRLNRNDLLAEEGEPMPVSTIVATFFKANPNYPIYRITIPPSCGYLARTQNLIHDGATNMQEEDIALLISGNFEINHSK